jgi:hypothetical protein
MEAMSTTETLLVRTGVERPEGRAGLPNAWVGLLQAFSTTPFAGDGVVVRQAFGPHPAEPARASKRDDDSQHVRGLLVRVPCERLFR